MAEGQETEEIVATASAIVEEKQVPKSESELCSGYFESSCVGTLAVILEEASPKWDDIGTNLGLSMHELPQKQIEDVQKCFKDMLHYSLTNPPEIPYKRSILLEAVKGINPELAGELVNDYDNDQELESKHLRTVMADLRPIENHWRKLGAALKIKQYKLDSCCPKDDHKDNFTKVLRKWMEQQAGEATLARLCNALEEAGYALLAKKIKVNNAVTDLLKFPALQEAMSNQGMKDGDTR